MPIKSYVVFPAPGQMNKLSLALEKLPTCDVFPAENKEVLVLVTDTKSQKEDDHLLATLNTMEDLQHFSLVSGFDEPKLN